MILRTIDDLIEFFGGNSEMADWLGIDQSAVSQWKIRQQIAAGWHLRLLAEVRRRGADVHPSVFGLSDDEAKGLFGPAKRKAVA